MSVSHQSQLGPSLTSLPLLDLINPGTRVPNVDHIRGRQKWPDRYEVLEVTQPGTSKPKLLRRWVNDPTHLRARDPVHPTCRFPKLC